MTKDLERHEREARANRLKEARMNAGLRGPKAVSDRFGFNENTYKAHESSRNGFGLTDAREYARAFGVSINWLNFGLGQPDDSDDAETYVRAPLISWVTAGALTLPDAEPETDDAPIALAPGLDPTGDWIALRVDGDSMNRISPHNSVIFVNRRERRPVPNACYIIGDGEGGATYKRYRPPNTWEPVSTNADHRPFDLPIGQEPEIIGRVRKTILDM